MSDIEKGAQLEESRHSFRKNSLATLSATAVNEPCSPPPSISSVETVFPDGGARAWLTVFGAFLALFCTFGQLNSFGTFQAWYAEHQLHQFPPSTIAWIGSLQLWVFFFSVSSGRACLLGYYSHAGAGRAHSLAAYSMPTDRGQSWSSGV